MIDSVSEQAGADMGLKKARRKSNPASDPIKLDRLPPHDAEMEEGVLGCQLIAPVECVEEVLLKLKGDAAAHYDLRHQIIQAELFEMFNGKIPIDVITLQQRLKDKGLLEQVNGIAYLSQIQDAVPSAANLAYYLDIVREKYLLRKWIQLCTEVVGRIYDYEGEVDALTNEVSQDLFRLCETGQEANEKPFREVVVEVSEKYLEKFRRGVKFRIGPQTGFNYLDSILPGFGNGQLIVVAARPRTGKSAIVMQMAEHIALVEKIPCAIISLEMSAASLGVRAVFQRAGADLTKFLNGFMSDADIEKLACASADMMKMGLFIDESPRMCIEELEVRARRMVRRHKLGVLFLDYFQLLYVRHPSKQWSRADELEHCSMRLKGLAKELNIPIVICAQLNREIDKETTRRPRLSDLRNTGQLEQDADVIMFLWKPDLSSKAWEKRVADILPRVPVSEDWKQLRTWKKNLAIVTCTVEKQREGRSGEDATLVFIKPWTRFVDAYRPPTVEMEPSETVEATEE
jgi:replicative DNA helicase